METDKAQRSIRLCNCGIKLDSPAGRLFCPREHLSWMDHVPEKHIRVRKPGICEGETGVFRNRLLKVLYRFLQCVRSSSVPEVPAFQVKVVSFLITCGAAVESGVFGRGQINPQTRSD